MSKHPETGVTGDTSHLTWELGTRLRSFRRAVHVLNHRAISSASSTDYSPPVNFLLPHSLLGHPTVHHLSLRLLRCVLQKLVSCPVGLGSRKGNLDNKKFILRIPSTLHSPTCSSQVPHLSEQDQGGQKHTEDPSDL